MQLHDCDSRQIRRWGWEAYPGQAGGPDLERHRAVRSGRVGLFAIEFRNGETWYYRAVPESLVEGFVLAESKGRFFKAEIRDRFTGAKEVG